MEVGALSQGGQVSLNVNKSTDNSVTTEKQPKEATKVSDNKNNNDTVKERDVKKAVDKLNKFLEDNKTHAEYEIHDKFKDIMIKIVDDKSGEVIQELPPKKILDMVAKMCEMVGILFDKKA